MAAFGVVFPRIEPKLARLQNDYWKHLATSHAYKVNFYYRTIVRDCEDAQLPQYKFDLCPSTKSLNNRSMSKWYYNSCKNCNKKVDYEGGGKYWCKKCDSHVKSAPPRYKLTIIVEDDSGTASFVMFDREVYQILQISAVDLKEKLSKDGKDDSSFLEELDMLINRKLLFRFHISKYNLSHSWDKYIVLRISDDEQLIKSFLDVNGGLQEKDVEIESIDESSKSSVVKDKELATVVCDNENPNVSFITPTKRPLDDATNVGIDDETSSAQRSTNKKKVVVKIEKEDNTNNG
ncbi:uncharacterized protein LOC110725504 [Chenopodium quinoa]|uniref:uncharacterized protein LOC110725504 n=1 Tax=Chenopodium quinoa TaxID=63459 RepID=UPI000B77C154|nr:uncharacterized protein LOC110725504 [Chenopodium quinoa]